MSGARFQYSIDNGQNWIDGQDDGFDLDEGSYEDVLVRQIDAADNIGEPASLGPITVDTQVDSPIAGLAEDTGILNSDQLTNNGQINVTGIEDGATWEFTTDGGLNWTEGTGSSFTLSDGTYTNVQVRQTDAAGNTAVTILGQIVVDGTVDDPVVALEADTGSSTSDLITNNGQINVTGIEDGATWEFTTDGGLNWTEGTGGSFTLTDGTYANVQVRQTDAAGNTATTILGQVVVDTAIANAVVALANDTGTSGTDRITTNGQINVTGLEDGATWEFSTNGGQNWQTGTGGSFTLTDGTYTNVQVRQTDAAGNTATTTLGQVVVDTSIANAVVALANDTGTSGTDRITSNGQINVTGLEDGATWEFSTNGGQNWQTGTGGSFTLTEGTYTNVQVRQTDAAGNTATTTLGQVVVDNTITNAVVALANDTGTSGTDRITSNGQINVTGLEDGATWEFSTNGGQNWQTGTGGSFTLTEGTYTNVQVRQTDAAGNTATTTLGQVVVDATIANAVVALANDTGSSAIDRITTNGQINVTGLEAGATWEFSTNGGQNWQTGTGGSFTLTEGTYTNVQVRQTDTAGNTATTTLGQVVVDTTITNAVVALANDTGTSGIDRITSNGQINVTGLEPGGTWQYSTNGGQSWQTGTGGSFTLAEGTYANVQVRQTDAAGNTATTTLGQVVVDATIANAVVALANDTGSSGTDRITSNGLINVTGLEAGATWQYSTNGGQNWTNGTGGSFTLTEGTYTNVQVRQTDVAGNTATTTLGQVVVDITVIAPNGALNTDTGTSNTDRVTSDGTINVTGLETGASWQYSTNGGQNWINGTGTSFTLTQGTYNNVQLRQTDLAGNVSTGRALTAFTIASPDAVNDVVSLNMGVQTRVIHPSQTDTDVEVVGLLQSDIGIDNSVPITVRPDQVGEVRIVVTQTALVAVGDAFRLDVIDAQGNVVYSAVTQNSLLGDVAGLPVLGVVGNNTLVANVPGLLPGQYSVVVRNDEGTLEQLLDTDGGGVSLQELGSAGVVLGPNNQAVILDAVDAALGTTLGALARPLLTPLLGTLNGSPVSALVGTLSTVLGTIGATALLDAVVGSVADALLSNTLSILQSTSITTTVTEHDFPNEVVGGNVITGQGGVGADNLAGGASVSLITHANGSSVVVPATGSVQITGEHGVLQISANGTYSYTAFGDVASIGQADVFTYTLSDGTVADTATLTVNIDGMAVFAGGDTASASVNWAFQTADLVTTSNGVIGVGGTPSYTSNSFTVTANTLLSGEVSVFLTAGAFASGSLIIERQNGASWNPVTTVPYNTTLGLLSTVASINLATQNLGVGTYRVRATLGGALSAANVNANIDATYTNQFNITGRTGATGNILSNDELGSPLTELRVFDPDVGTFVTLSGSTSITIDGTYGSLQISGNGSYSYTVGSGFAHFTTTQVDSFNYQLVHPNGQVSNASLGVSVQPTGAGVPAVTTNFAAEPDPDDFAGLLEYSMLEDQGSIEDVLENYLREAEETQQEPVDNIPEPVQSPDDVSGPPDDLNYLNDPISDPLSDDQNGNYLI